MRHERKTKLGECSQTDCNWLFCHRFVFVWLWQTSSKFDSFHSICKTFLQSTTIANVSIVHIDITIVVITTLKFILNFNVKYMKRKSILLPYLFLCMAFEEDFAWSTCNTSVERTSCRCTADFTFLCRHGLQSLWWCA